MNGKEIACGTQTGRRSEAADLADEIPLASSKTQQDGHHKYNTYAQRRWRMFVPALYHSFPSGRMSARRNLFDRTQSHVRDTSQARTKVDTKPKFIYEVSIWQYSFCLVSARLLRIFTGCISLSTLQICPPCQAVSKTHLCKLLKVLCTKKQFDFTYMPDHRPSVPEENPKVAAPTYFCVSVAFRHTENICGFANG